MNMLAKLCLLGLCIVYHISKFVVKLDACCLICVSDGDCRILTWRRPSLVLGIATAGPR